MINYDKTTKDIIINGFEKGISDNPYEGISDCRNINLISIPKEASVNFRTSSVTDTNRTGTVISADAGADTVLLNANTPVNLQAIVFAGASLPAGIIAGTVYWVVNVSGANYNLYKDYAATQLLDITGTGTGTWATVTMSTPKYFTHLKTAYTDSYFMVDSAGKVWSDLYNAGGAGWRYTGNTIDGTSHGNGLINYVSSNSFNDTIGYIFVFRDFSIDYATITSNTSLVWTYGWNPTTAATGESNYLKAYGIVGGLMASHEALLAPDNVVYFCDASYIGRFFEQTGKTFLPTDINSYIFDETRLLPFTDTAQCLAFLGTSVLIGGKLNVIYPWDTTSPTFSYPILLSEYDIQKMVTVNTNTFIFVGNRGRIYYTNGTNAQLYKKIPDHLSGTIEPYFTWGGACSNKNQLYFSALVTNNAGTALTAYGGLWAIDLDTKAIRLTNKLSYDTYAGYASAMIPIFSSAPAGTGLYIGWQSGTPTYGIDVTVGFPYTSGESYIDSDLVPIGTTLKPTTSGRVEFKLAVPIVSGEIVKLQYRQKFSSTFTDIDANTIFNFAGIASGTWNGYAGVYQNVNFENSQWIQIRAVLSSINNNPSYVRLTELRLGN